VTFQTVSGQAYAVLSQTTFGFSLIGAFLLFREVPSAPQWVAGVVIVLTSGVGALGNENAFDALLARGRRRLLSLLQSLATKIVHWAILAGQPLLEDIVRQAQSTSPVPTASTANIEEIVQRLEATLQRLSELEEAQAISTPPLLISSVQTALPSPKPTSALITDGAGHTARVTKASDEVIETTWSFAKISVAPVDTEAMEVSSDAGCVNVQYREGTYTAFMPFTQAATSPQRLIHIVRAQVQHDLVISIEFPRSIDITPIYEGETTLIKGAVITGNNNYQALSFGTAKNLGVVEEGDKHVLTVQVTLPRDAYYSVAMVTAKDAHQAHLLVEELGREDFRPEMARTAKVWRTWLDQLGGNFSEEQKRALLTIRGSFLPTGEVVASPEVAAAVEAMGKGRPTKYLQIAVIAAQCLAEAGLIEAMTFVTWLASVIEEKQDIPMNEIYQLLQFLRDNWMYQKFNYPAEIATPIFRSLEAAYMR